MNNADARRTTQTEHEDNRRHMQQEAQAKRRRTQDPAEIFCRQRHAAQQTPAHEDSPREPVSVACKAWILGRCSRPDHNERHPTGTAIVCCSERIEGNMGYSEKFRTCPFENYTNKCPYEHPETDAATAAMAADEIANTAAECEAYVDRARAAEAEPEDDL